MTGTISEMIVLLVIALVIAAIVIIPSSKKNAGNEEKISDQGKDEAPSKVVESQDPANRKKKKG